MSKKKIDFEKAKEIIESNSMKLIWTEEEFISNYKTTTDTKIPVLCSCKRKKELKLANIRNGSTCRECADERNRNLQKKNRTTFCMAVDICKENGFKLTWSEEEYNENFETMTKPIPVKCGNCEKESNRTLTNVKTGTRCKHCVVPKTRLLQYDEVKDVYIQNGMKLLWNENEFSEKFTGCDQKIPVICICNEKKELCYTNVRQGHKCQDCGNNRKKNYDEVVKIVEDSGLQLNMSEEKFNDVYKGMNSPITILCKCEKEYTVRINDVKFGYKCKDCGFEKSKNTNIERFGFPYAIQSEEIKEKIRITNIERYGVSNPLQSEEIKEKIRITNVDRYGVANVMQNAEIFIRSQINSSKLFEFPSGKVIDIHGYENFALKELLESGIFEEDIVTEADLVPEIWYIDGENKKHRHYVDIYIKSLNRCIEVKSEWTLKLQEEFMSYKQNAAKTIGCEYEIWIYDNRGVKIREEK